LLPANPTLGRTILNGRYYINGISIEQTSFRVDPEFAILDPAISNMLKVKNLGNVFVLGKDDTMNGPGIYVAEVAQFDDIRSFIDKANDKTIFAGAGDAFEVLLMNHTKLSQQAIEGDFLLQTPALYINGSKFNKSLSNFLEDKKAVIHYFSANILSKNEDQSWYEYIDIQINKNKKVLIAIDDEVIQELKMNAIDLRNKIAVIINNIVNTYELKELCIEGGSTAATIFEALSLNVFIPSEEISRGVIRMFAPQKNIFITVKPGSYQLPKTIVQQFLN
jgi:uncharacterized protein YgbK (DUF1537 family)